MFHRNVGRLVALAANIHAIGYSEYYFDVACATQSESRIVYKWVMQGTWTEKTKLTFVRWGLVALVSIDILFFFALGLIRQRYYNFFYISHSIALVVLLVAVSFPVVSSHCATKVSAQICLHQSFAIPYVIIAAAFYGVDHILRILKSRTPYAYLQPIPDLGTTLVRIPTLNAGWRAGQFVRLRIISRSMGLYGWAEAHPYTIANACEGGGADGMVFMVKKTGGWTRKLYDIAFAPTESEARSEARVRVIVEGPYGEHLRGTSSQFLLTCDRRSLLHHLLELLRSTLCCRWKRYLVWAGSHAGDSSAGCTRDKQYSSGRVGVDRQPCPYVFPKPSFASFVDHFQGLSVLYSLYSLRSSSNHTNYQ